MKKQAGEHHAPQHRGVLPKLQSLERGVDSGYSIFKDQIKGKMIEKEGKFLFIWV